MLNKAIVSLYNVEGEMVQGSRVGANKNKKMVAYGIHHLPVTRN
jgi:hypothetical protein